MYSYSGVRSIEQTLNHTVHQGSDFFSFSEGKSVVARLTVHKVYHSRLQSLLGAWAPGPGDSGDTGFEVLDFRTSGHFWFSTTFLIAFTCSGRSVSDCKLGSFRVLQATTIDEEELITCAAIELLLDSKFAFKVFGFIISKSSLIRKKCILSRSVPILTKKKIWSHLSSIQAKKAQSKGYSSPLWGPFQPLGPNQP